MANATAYGNYIYDQKPLQYQPDNITSQVAQVKNQLFDNAYRNIESMKANVLNMRLLNEQAQSKVDGYNKKISEFFDDKKLSQMDLADFDIANQMTTIFSEIGSDSEIRLHKQKTDEFLALDKTWKEAAKNPAKSGYSKENHEVWMVENLQNYVKGNSQAALGTNVGTFMPYYDYMSDLKNLKDGIKFDGQKFEIVDPKNPGVKETIEISGVTPEKINKLLRAGLPAQAITQMQTEAKAVFYRGYLSSPETQSQMVDQIHGAISTQAKQNSIKIQSEIDVLDGQLKVADPKEIADLEIKRAGLVEDLNNNKFTLTKADFQKKSKEELASYYGNLAAQDKLKMLSEAIAPRIEKRTSGLNQPYYKQLEYNLSVQKQNYAMQKDNRDFEYEVQQDAIDNQLKAAAIEGRKGKDTKAEKDFYGDPIPGEYLDYTGSATALDKEIEMRKLSNIVDLKELTLNDVKAIHNGQRPELNFLKETIDKAVKLNGRTDEAFGAAMQLLNQDIKKGRYDDARNTAAAKVNILVNQKDHTWNLAAQEFAKVGDEFVGLLGDPQGPAKQKLLNRLNSDPVALKNFTAIWDRILSEQSGTGKKFNYTINTESAARKTFISTLPFVDEEGKAQVFDSKDIDWNSVYSDGKFFHAKMSTGSGDKKETVSIKTPVPVGYELPGNDEENAFTLKNGGQDTKFYKGHKIQFYLNNGTMDYKVSDPDGKEIISSLTTEPLMTQDVNVAFQRIASVIEQIK